MEPWLYRFEQGTLLEELDGRRFVYGLWDNLFGCWEVDANSHTNREIVPTWIPLNSRGIWRDHLDVRFESAARFGYLFSPKWRYEANAAFAAFFSNIPVRIRGVVAPLGQHQWVALDMIWQVPEFAHFLDEEFYNGSQQYVLACLALANAASLSRADRRDLATSIMQVKRTDMLSDLSGKPVSRKSLRLLYKLGEHPCDRDVYSGLLNIVSQENLAKTLSHADSIDPEILELVCGLPEYFQFPNLARIFFDDPETCRSLLPRDNAGSNFQTIVDLYPRLSPQWRDRTMSSLAAVTDADGFIAWSDQWSARLIAILRFPAPPFSATPHLTPLTTAAAMQQEGRDMQNCVSGMIGRVVAGEVYFYRANCSVPATVMIEKSRGAGWRFSEAHGYDNQQLPPQTRHALEVEIDRSLKAADSKLL
jgi:hypothetical protein